MAAMGSALQTGPPVHQPLYMLMPSQLQPGVQMQPAEVGFHLHAEFSQTLPSPKQTGDTVPSSPRSARRVSPVTRVSQSSPSWEPRTSPAWRSSKLCLSCALSVPSVPEATNATNEVAPATQEQFGKLVQTAVNGR